MCGLVKTFKEGTAQKILRLVLEMATEKGEKSPNTHVQLTFVKLIYMMGGYIPALRDIDLENRLVRESVNYERKLHGVSDTDSFCSSGKKMTVSC